MNVDDKIKLLKEEIARLEKSKNVDESILTKTGDFKIKVYGDESHYYDIIRINGLSNSDLLNGLKVGTELRLYWFIKLY